MGVELGRVERGGGGRGWEEFSFGYLREGEG